MLSLRFLSSISLLTNFRRFVHMSSAHSVGIRRYYYGYDRLPLEKYFGVEWPSRARRRQSCIAGKRELE